MHSEGACNCIRRGNERIEKAYGTHSVGALNGRSRGSQWRRKAHEWHPKTSDRPPPTQPPPVQARIKAARSPTQSLQQCPEFDTTIHPSANLSHQIAKGALNPPMNRPQRQGDLGHSPQRTHPSYCGSKGFASLGPSFGSRLPMKFIDLHD